MRSRGSGLAGVWVWCGGWRRDTKVVGTLGVPEPRGRKTRLAGGDVVLSVPK